MQGWGKAGPWGRARGHDPRPPVGLACGGAKVRWTLRPESAPRPSLVFSLRAQLPSELSLSPSLLLSLGRVQAGP